MQVEGNTTSYLCLIAFGIGVLVGYQLKDTRMKYLKWRRDRLMVKAKEFQEKIYKESI